MVVFYMSLLPNISIIFKLVDAVVIVLLFFFLYKSLLSSENEKSASTG